MKSWSRTWYYEKKLWHLYDCNDYALNLYHCPTVAYSGERDSQKQAADVMEKAMAAEGIKLVHVIGINAKHFYTPQGKAEVNRRIDSIVEFGRDPLPRKLIFTTWTLRYNQVRWLTIDTLGKHWERARVELDQTSTGATVKTQNVTGLTLNVPPGYSPLDINAPTTVTIDGQALKGAPVLSDRSWISHFQKKDSKWALVDTSAGSEVKGGTERNREDARLTRPDRRCLHGPLHLREAHGQATQLQSRRLGCRRDGSCGRALAPSIPRRSDFERR